MPRPPDHHSADDTSTATEAELRLLDLLYGELDDSEAEQARRAVDEDEDLAADLAGLTSMRALFRDLPDAEPPQAVSAKLLQAAAAHAPRPAATKAKPGGGFWAWLSGLFAPIVRYPGLAAVASLVLVAGVAGALYLGGKGRTTEPTASDSKQRGEKADRGGVDEGAPGSGNGTTTAPTTPTTGDSPARYADIEQVPSIVDQWNDNQPDDADERASKSGETSKAEDRRAPKKTAPDPTGRGGRAGGEGSRKDGVTVTSESTISLDDGELDSNRDESADKSPPKVSEPSTKPSDDPPPPPAEPKGMDVDVPAPDVKSVPSKDDKKAKNAKAEELHKKATTAAKRGDCTATNSYGSEIRSIDVGYYNDVYLRDATVRKCAATQNSQSTKK